jgi:putative endopeptidase
MRTVEVERLLRLALILGLCAGGALSGARGGAAAGAPETAPPPGGPPAPAVASGVDLSALDRTASPCGDFFAFACGGWLASHPIPADEAIWSRGRELALRIDGELRAILERDSRARPAGEAAVPDNGAAAERRAAELQQLADEQQKVAEEQARLSGELAIRIDEQPERAAAQQRLAAEQERLAGEQRRLAGEQHPHAAEQQKLGDDYASCMDEAANEAKGLGPLAPQLGRIASLRSAAELPALVAELHRLGVAALFSFDVIPDPWRGGTTVARVSEGALGLADPADYLRADPASVEERRLYGVHLEHVFALLGDAPSRAAEEAAAALAVETFLARTSPRAAGAKPAGDPFQRMSRAELTALTPGFDWSMYLGALGAPPMETLAIAAPGSLRQLPALLAPAGALDRLKSYFRWQLVDASTDLLPRAFAAESFAFFGRGLDGTSQGVPRWRRCVAATAADLGGSLARAWADEALDESTRSGVEKIVRDVQRSLASDLTTLPWLSEATKRGALLKIRSARAMIGGPAAEAEVAALRIVRGDALGNRQRAAAFQLDRQVATIGQAPDPGFWPLAPADVEALYDPLRNALDLPVAVAQAPLFDPRRDDAANFGALGCRIGEALSGGLAEPDRRFDSAGRWGDPWVPADAAEVERRSACFAGQYDDLRPADSGQPFDGRPFVDQGVAESGGVRVAYLAYHAKLAGRPEPQLDGFSPEQRFFLAFAQSRCGTATPEAARRQLANGLAVPPRWQVDGALSNLPEFARAWSCPAGSSMVRPSVCRLW